MTKDDLQKLFTFTPISGVDAENVGAVRAAGLEFAEEILKRAPDCSTRDSAIQHVLEAVMMTNLTIANSIEKARRDA